MSCECYEENKNKNVYQDFHEKKANKFIIENN